MLRIVGSGLPFEAEHMQVSVFRAPAALALLVGLAFAAPARAQLETKLSESIAGFNYGQDVAIDGSTVLVGVPFSDAPLVFQGSAYLYTHSSGTWVREALLTASDGALGDGFGGKVDLEGDTAVLSSSDAGGLGAGAVYVFTRSGTVWTERTKLLASDAASNDSFGRLALAGDTLVVGAPGDDDAGESSGSAYVFTGSGATWAEQAKLTAADAAAMDLFGQSVDVDGDTAVVGARRHDGAGSDAGAVYVFTRSGTSWTQQARLFAPDASPGGAFGAAVAISGDRLVAGAPFHNSIGPVGSAYVFRRTAGVWAHEATLEPAGLSPSAHCGEAVSIEGDRVLVGARLQDLIADASGAAYLFARNGTTWNQLSRLQPSDLLAGDEYGTALELAGDWAVVSAPTVVSGAVYVHRLPAPDAVTYCTGKTNSAGCLPFLSVLGPASVTSTIPAQIRADDILAGRAGLLLYGHAKANLSFHGGKLCIKAPIERWLPTWQPGGWGEGACEAFLLRNFNSRIQGGADPLLTAGHRVHAQWLQRDPFDPTLYGDSLTNAVRFTILP